MKRFVGALHRYQSIKSAQWADIYVRVLASQGSSKPNSKCIISYFQWFFSTDKTIYNLLSLQTVLTPCWDTEISAKLQKKLRNLICDRYRFQENCPHGKLPPSPNSNANPKPNADPDRGAIFLGGNLPNTIDIWSTFLIKMLLFSEQCFFPLFNKLLLKISDNRQENTNAGNFFWIKTGLSCMRQLYLL